MASPAEQAQVFRRLLDDLTAEVGRVIVGHATLVERLIAALAVGGHVLLEGNPGLGKTLLVRTLAAATGLSFSRIQFTPDLMPADILGTQVIQEDAAGRKHFEFSRGPVFGQVVLADEVNRATPKTQSALLEAMQEGAVTVGGQRHELPAPFFVLATQNPIEMEGTYPLPEAQLDRFLFKLQVLTPSEAELVSILERTTAAEDPRAASVLDAERLLQLRRLVRQVPAAEPVTRYAARLVLATHPSPPPETRAMAPPPVEAVRRWVRYGASPRAAQAMVLAAKLRALRAGRWAASFEDVADAAAPALRHRIILNFEGEAEGVSADRVVQDVLAAVQPLPAEVQHLVSRAEGS